MNSHTNYDHRQSGTEAEVVDKNNSRRRTTPTSNKNFTNYLYAKFCVEKHKHTETSRRVKSY